MLKTAYKRWCIYKKNQVRLLFSTLIWVNLSLDFWNWVLLYEKCDISVTLWFLKLWLWYHYYLEYHKCLWLLWLLDFKIARWTHLPDLFSSLNVWSCVPRNSARNLLGAFGSLKQPSKKKSVFAVDSEMKTDAQTVSAGMYSKKQAINPSIFFYFHSFIDCWTLTIWVPLFLSLFCNSSMTHFSSYSFTICMYSTSLKIMYLKSWNIISRKYMQYAIRICRSENLSPVVYKSRDQ